jgi:hypothetical protein
VVPKQNGPTPKTCFWRLNVLFRTKPNPFKKIFTISLKNGRTKKNL